MALSLVVILSESTRVEVEISTQKIDYHFVWSGTLSFGELFKTLDDQFFTKIKDISYPGWQHTHTKV